MSDFAQQALEELQKVTGSDNRDNPWLGVVAAVYLWHTRIEQLTKACEALLDAHDQSFVGREEMRDLYYSAHPRRAAAYKQARKAIESVRGIEANYPDPGCEAAARERDEARAHPITCACGDHIGYAEDIGLSQEGAICGNCAVGRTDYDARTELTTLRALLAAIIQCAGSMRTPPYADAIQSSAYGHGRVDLANELRALIAKTEAK